MEYRKVIQFTLMMLTLIFMINISSAATYTGPGTYEVKQGDLITIGDYGVDVLSVKLDSGQPQVYISRGGVGYTIHEGESHNILLNKMSSRYVMIITVKEIDIDSGTALVQAEEYIYDSDPDATKPKISNQGYTQYGPFNDLKSVQIGDGLIGFVYSDNLKDYNVKINNDEYGPFTSVKYFTIYEDLFGFVYRIDDEYYIRINDDTYGPFLQVMDLEISKDNWAFAYQNSSGFKFVQSKNSLSGPYSYLLGISLSGNSLAYAYGTEEGYNVIVNGNIVGEKGSVEVSENGRYAFCYFEDKKGYCNVDGKIFGPYGTGLGATVSDNHLILSYQDKLEDGGKYYKIVDDKNYGPYDYSYHSEVSNDLFAFSYDVGDNSYININGKVYGPYDKSGSLANLIIDEDNYAYSYRDDTTWKTVVNGEALICPQGNGVSSIDFHNNDFIFSCGTRTSKYVFINTDDISDFDTDSIKQNSDPDATKPDPNTDITTSDTSNQCSGCFEDDNCYTLGYRKNKEFCSDEKQFIIQNQKNSICESNFECESNLCIDDKCVSGSLWTKFIRWLNSIFG